MADTTLDQGAVTLTKAIRQVESGNNFTQKGGSGEYGAYQFLPSTWDNYSKAAGVNVPLAQATPEQQNQVAYTQVKKWKDAGYNVGQIASMWNAGEGKPNAYVDGNAGTNSSGVQYDTAAYAKNVATAYQTLKTQAPIDSNGDVSIPDTSAPSAPTYGALFPASPDDNPLVAGAKATGNLIPSAIGFGKSIFDAVTHPLTTLQGVGQAAIGGVEKLTGQAPDINTQTFDSVAQALKDRYGSLEALQNTATNDPFGFGTDIVSLLSGGAGLVGKGAELGELGSRAAQLVTKPLAGAAETTADLAGGIAKIGASKITGLEPGTIGEITRNPAAFTPDAIASASRADLATEVGDALNSRIDALRDTGSGYNDVRDLRAPNLDVSPETTKSVALGNGKTLVYPLEHAPDELLSLPELRKKVQLLSGGADTAAYNASKANLDARAVVENVPHTIKVPKTWLKNQFKDVFGVTVGKDGKVTATLSSKVRDAKDIRALEDLYQKGAPAFSNGSLTTEEFLNFREELAKIARYDREITKSAALDNLAKIVRGNFNDRFRAQVPGLDKLDEGYSAQISDLERLRKGLIDGDGNLLDSAINKIANSTGKGKDQLLGRLEEIIPGITQRIKVQKAIEDIHAAMGNKVGTYAASTLGTGGVIAGLATGNMPLVAGALAAAIMATPEVAVPLLRAYGMNRELVTNVMARLRLNNKAYLLPAGAATSETERLTAGGGVPADATGVSVPEPTPETLPQ